MANERGRAKAKAAGIVLASASLVTLISNFEAVKLTTYRDIIGIPTVCAGITDPDIAIMGKTYTKAECEAFDRGEIEGHGSDAMACINTRVTQKEFESYSSLNYNIGARNFCGSTLIKKLNSGDHVGACQEILRWNKAGGKVVAGLDNRRRSEFRLCMDGIAAKDSK